MKQYARNACGTVGIFHILTNLITTNPELFKEDSKISKFLTETKNKSSHERGESFKNDNGIKSIHKKNVSGGQTSVESSVDSHFIALIPVGKYTIFYLYL